MLRVCLPAVSLVQRVYEDMVLAPINLQDEWSQRLMQVSWHMLVTRLVVLQQGITQHLGNPCWVQGLGTAMIALWLNSACAV
jgi:hypothetical protein